MDENLKNKLDEVGSKIDDKVEETSANHNVPKWVIWLGGAVAVSLIVKLLF